MDILVKEKAGLEQEIERMKDFKKAEEENT